MRVPRSIPALISLPLAGVAGGVLVVVGAASRKGLGLPGNADLLIAAGVGLAVGAALSPIASWQLQGRKASQVLPTLVFPALGACVLLGPYGNHPLTLSGVAVAFMLSAVAIGFFLPKHTPAPTSRRTCPACHAPVSKGQERCPNCAVQLLDVNAGNSSSLPASSSTRSA